MLGLADRSRIIDLFEALMRGDIAARAEGAARSIRCRRRPGGRARRSRRIHPFRHAREDRAGGGRGPLARRSRAHARARRSPPPCRCACSRAPGRCCSRACRRCRAPRKPIAAAEMVLVRIAYAADLPTPDEVIRSLSDGCVRNGPPLPQRRRRRSSASPRRSVRIAHPIRPRGGAARGARAAADTVAKPRSGARKSTNRSRRPLHWSVSRFEDLIALAAERRDLQTKTALERDVRLVRFEDGKLEIALEPSASKALIDDLSRKLAQWTGRRWMVVVSAEPGPADHPRADRGAARRARARRAGRSAGEGRARPFPGAEIVAVRERTRRRAYAGADADETMPEPPIEDESPAFGEQAGPTTSTTTSDRRQAGTSPGTDEDQTWQISWA